MNTQTAPVSRLSRNNVSLLARMRASTAAMLEDERRARLARCAEIVDFAGGRIAVTGAVRRPVVFMWDEGVTVLDAIAIAQGPRGGATRALILRRTDDGVQQIHVDLEAGREACAIRLRRGDEVRVIA